MPLDDYGVLSGTLHRHFRDQPDTQGRWFHVNLEVDAPAGRYRCAVDVDSKQSTTGVQWKVFTLEASALGPVAGQEPGYQDLARSPGSGALDYIRHPALVNRAGCVFVRRPPAWLQAVLNRLNPPRPWTSGSNLDAAQALEPILVPGRVVMVFGEPFGQGLGMHNIHQNQGDPYGSQWWDENGIWQDGATMTRRPDGRFDVFLSKFSTQADRTDNDGHPA
ncbi:hypothetical protein AR457_32800 [Streptomyces agglomeratus]|uniref:DUF2278 domain-containing protein n=1 Tax=Streptomyces agglomeratus TaxID=285458 RepID=A0A1E5PGB6_9ACTN|nr:DUF2278 family protein [Streptomyces agglomeratus]OEJ28535.1 hypothetical protein AS594_32710 [Streptomyces agglomeratus]OEJ37400.1 hypothetical protein BGK70_03860 [Streptomyces agglomeratus]OEJ48215.1 hypothetical protein AR457_32800 [Streptomyces agglomeratus]OEJ57269.1 hypothetical protein BGM19_04045 [Streptomyces agglomeratus]